MGSMSEKGHMNLQNLPTVVPYLGVLIFVF